MGPRNTGERLKRLKRIVLGPGTDKATKPKLTLSTSTPLTAESPVTGEQGYGEVRDFGADILQSNSSFQAYLDSNPGIVTKPADQIAESPPPAVKRDQIVQARNLWADALETLSDQDKAAILQPSLAFQAHSGSGLDMFQHLCTIAEQKRDDCEKRGWKFKLNGRQIILRDLAQKIIVWVEKIYEILYLHDKQSGQVVEDLELVDASQEPIVRDPESAVTNPELAVANLKSALVALYAAMLRFLSTANRLYDKGFGARTVHGILSPGELVSFVDECQRLETRVDIEASNCERTYSHLAYAKLGECGERLKRLLAGLREPVMRVDSRVAALHDRLDESEQIEILTWVSDIPYESNHYTARRERTGGTGEWLLRHERYREWRKSSASTILWLHGIPGAGKTKLVSTVVDDLLGSFGQHPNDEALAYFYCDRNESVRQDPELILRSFARQLSVSRNSDAIQHSLVQLYYQKRKNGFASGKLKIEESRDVLLQLVRIYPQTTLVLDALDECHKETRAQLVDILDMLITQSPKPVKIFISSRPDRDIKHRFECGPNVHIKATDNHDDIAKFVDDRLNNSPEDWRNSISPDLKREIREVLVDKSEGMFQWASLQIIQLRGLLPRERDIRERLGKLPKTLDKAYDEIYAQIQTQEGSAPEIANRAFQWVMCSCTPLLSAELVAAVCQDPETDEIDHVDIDISIVLAACCNLLVVDQELRVCRFSHLSVQEYFEKHHWNQSQANGLVAKVCLSMLNDPIQQNLGPEAHGQDGNDGIRGVVQYARIHWATHVQGHGEEAIDDRLAIILKRFLGSMDESGPSYRNWLRMISNFRFPEQRYRGAQIYRIYERLTPPSLASFTICTFGFHKILSSWWVFGPANVDQKNHRGYSLLGLAALEGFDSITEELLAKGADVNAQGGHYGDALQAASYGGHNQVIQRLLEKGADVNAQGGRYGNALQAASYDGHDLVIQRLLEKGADVNAQGGLYGNALQAASYRGHDLVTQRLLEKGADVNAQGGRYGNALQAASSGGHDQAIQRLLEKGADVNAQGGRYGNALQAASSGGHDQAIQRLLEKGADVNAQGGRYGNALQAASSGGHDQAIQRLLEKGADVNAQGGRYGNALQAASYDGHDLVIQRLLEKGADVNAQGGPYGNALQAASSGGHDLVIQRLLEKGADVNAQGGYYGNALQAASSGGHDLVIQRLLEKGADVNAQGGYYGNALQAASSGGHDLVIQRLLEKGADVNAQGGVYGNALQAASSGGHDQVIQRLLKKGADVNAQGGYYGNALQAASSGGHDKVVQRLKSAAQSR
ncbi:hypothetical protein FGG08_004945 [Glutinoglossum americanum]|uniref:NACHT domain-containing protein n=1 Tax=Glutinoglossum americanum TaxID=1670608 RepID=A0A9P8I402_9PEZI|nr:hypothetical protein FGG08_004945 [Glutinoglossum americanum]